MGKIHKFGHIVELSKYDFQLLSKNMMISALYDDYLKTAKHDGEIVKLSLTLKELEELTGAVAAESNHATSRRKQEEFGAICDYFEDCIDTIMRR
ncbi:MAG: hypothetical protein K8S23_14705 [Candidatus Cloacimonetes bacterium]|nr:hypothetical protein [Candidatus Cloacimonadota bacterium]